MPLLGRPLLALLGLLALALPILTLLLWRRASGARVLVVGRRLAMVALCQLAAVSFVAAAANNYGDFYGSWSDLGRQLSPTASSGGHAVRPTSHGALSSGPQGSTSQRVKHLSMAPWSKPADYATKGRLESVRLPGARSALSTHAFVYLPPQYFQPKYQHTRFPVSEVFTGYPGNDLNLVRRLAYQDRLRTEIAHGRARPMVLVMMRSSDAYPRDAECTDVPNGPQAMTMFSQDVPYDISHAYRVRETGWGAIGDSTGGYCAVKLVLQNAYTFSAGAALSGYYHVLQDVTTGNLWGGSSVLRDLNDPEWRLTHLPQPPVSLLLTSSNGETGPNGVSDLRKFVALARAPLHVDTIVLPHGGHNLGAWSQELGPALDWLSHRVSQA